MRALAHLVPDESLARALDLVSGGKVTRVTALPSGRSFYKVAGKNRQPYMVLMVGDTHAMGTGTSAAASSAAVAKVLTYCSCPDHVFAVAKPAAKDTAVGAGTRVHCKHVLAARLASAIGRAAERLVEDIRVEDFLAPEVFVDTRDGTASAASAAPGFVVPRGS